jgi:hypothetical protein
MNQILRRFIAVEKALQVFTVAGVIVLLAYLGYSLSKNAIRSASTSPIPTLPTRGH